MCYKIKNLHCFTLLENRHRMDPANKDMPEAVNRRRISRYRR